MNVRSAVAALPLVIGFLVAAEVTARVDDRIREGVPFAHTPDYETDLHVVDSLGFHGRPSGRYHQYQLNNLGFRGPDVSPRPQPGCVRVMVLGASESFGYFEAPGQEYPAQLRDSLQSKGCFDVVNAAIAGMGLRSIINYWNTFASRFGATVVVVYAGPTFYLGNDAPKWPVSSAATNSATGSAEAPWRPRLLDRLHNVISTPDFIQRHRVERWIAGDIAGKPTDWLFRTPPPDRLAAYVSDLDSLVRAVQATGAVPVVMTHATRFSTPIRPEDEFLFMAWRRYNPRATSETMLAFEQAAAQAARDYAACTHVSLVDADSALSGKRDLFEDAIHLTNGGASVVAGLLAHQISLSLDTRPVRPRGPCVEMAAGNAARPPESPAYWRGREDTRAAAR